VALDELLQRGVQSLLFALEAAELYGLLDHLPI
jgi:hypothetical protein